MNIEHRTSNINLEWKKMTKQAYDLEERLLEYSVRIREISLRLGPRDPSWRQAPRPLKPFECQKGYK